MCLVRRVAVPVLAGLLLAGSAAILIAGPWATGPFVPREPEVTAESLAWQTVFTLRATGGWRDNALLAGTNAQSTPFAGTGLELFLFRLPVDANRFTLMLTGDDRRYLNRVEPAAGQATADGETVVATQAEYRRILNDRLSISIVGQHLYADQVFDASSLADGLGTVQATVHSLSAFPSLRWSPSRSVHLDAGYQWQRQNFMEPLDGFWATGPRVSAGWDYRPNSAIEAQWRLEDRPYDSRPAANLLGIPEPGTVAQFTQQHAELVWRHQWIDRFRLRSTVRVFYLANRDEAVGFYDFDRIGVAAGLRMDWSAWTASAGARWSHWTYARQFVSPAPEDLFNYRRRDDLELTLRLQRRFGTHLAVFLEELYERQESNVSLETFGSHTAQAGLEWEF